MIVIGKHKKAFLLIEVLISVIILSVGIVFSLRSFHHIMRLSHRSVQFFRAELRAEELLLEARFGFESGYGSKVSGKIDSEEATHYMVDKVRLRLDLSDDETEEQNLLVDDITYDLVTLSINAGDTVLLDLPFIIKESSDDAQM